ncbi:DNA binding domain-containing protein, excisionase family [Gillisia sp. Hel1_33_143]|uniref:helix-turn-helix domain-containing protein n=1 Tax=Gillisia sp. Hel1_33_143 TaxID=1336796 RepID=UPI00087A228D|nr:helix-turn-helix domain-containing protein [Gillisia sp. Hel1_33_143]SDS74767.1 DNA binding domain-containing protein, excisionase family [Gillisia sp. Hel1_33_143]
MNELKILEQLDRIEKIVCTNKAVLTFDQACDYTGISRSYMYKLTARGEIPFSKPKGKLIFFSREKLDSWLLNNSHSSKDQIKDQAVAYTFRNKRF